MLIADHYSPVLRMKFCTDDFEARRQGNNSSGFITSMRYPTKLPTHLQTIHGTDPRSYIRTLINDPTRLRETLDKGHRHLASLVATLHNLITPRIGMGLLRRLSFSEIMRSIEMTVKTDPSDLCGQARFLRGIIVSHPLDRGGKVETDSIMGTSWRIMKTTIEELWAVFFWVERLESEYSKHKSKLNTQQIEQAGFAATMGRTDIDMGFVEPVEERCREVFTSLDQEFVVPTFGLRTDHLLAGFPFIKKQFERRINDVNKLATNKNIVQLGDTDIINRIFQQRLETSLEITETDLPPSWTQPERQAFLDAFSLIGGEHNQGFTRPSHDNITLRKPLLRLSDGRYFLIDPIFCRYAPNRLLCHAVETSKFRDRYLRLRDESLERRVGQLFDVATHPITHYSNVYLPVGEKGDLAEQDHIVIADECAFFIECKAKRIRSPLTHGGNASKVRDDLRASIQAGFEQGERARLYFMTAKDSIPIFDKYKNTIGVIKRDAFNTTHVIVATWEYLSTLSVDLQPWLSVPTGSEYPWVIWVDDLQTALTRLHPASEIARYITWRSQLNGRLMAGDEMQVVGCFLAKHTDIPPGDETIVIDGKYASIFDDDYFASLGVKREVIPPDPKPAIIHFSEKDGQLTARLKNKILFRRT